MHIFLVSVACTSSQYLISNCVKWSCALYLSRWIKNLSNFQDRPHKLRWQPHCFPTAMKALSSTYTYIYTNIHTFVYIHIFICMNVFIKLLLFLGYLGSTVQPCLTALTCWYLNMHTKENGKRMWKRWPSRQLWSMGWAAFPSRFLLETPQRLHIISGSTSADINSHDACFVW